MRSILLFPFNGNAREAASVIEDLQEFGEAWEIVGFVDDDPETHGKRCGPYRVLGGREQFKEHSHASVLAVPGNSTNFWNRETIISSLGIPDSRFASVIHPSVRLGIGCTCGRNVLLMSGVVATTDVHIGHHVVILPNTVLSHDVTVDDLTMLGSNVSLSGAVHLGRSSYIGTGSRIIQNVHVAEHALVGMGSVVIGDVEAGTVVAGCPARKLKDVACI
jgi:sugar O-acyltransferase (sialic acid O-acetyltransferase NeuD family)